MCFHIPSPLLLGEKGAALGRPDEGDVKQDMYVFS